MAFSWHEYLVLARWLLANPPPGVSEEAVQRAAISRAYYAAFGHALNYAVAYLGFQPRDNENDHGRLRQHLKNRKRKRVAECLGRLRDWRNPCDYENETGDLAPAVPRLMEDAQYVFDALPPPASPS